MQLLSTPRESARAATTKRAVRTPWRAQHVFWGAHQPPADGVGGVEGHARLGRAGMHAEGRASGAAVRGRARLRGRGRGDVWWDGAWEGEGRAGWG